MAVATTGTPAAMRLDQRRRKRLAPGRLQAHVGGVEVRHHVGRNPTMTTARPRSAASAASVRAAVPARRSCSRRFGNRARSERIASTATRAPSRVAARSHHHDHGRRRRSRARGARRHPSAGDRVTSIPLWIVTTLSRASPAAAQVLSTGAVRNGDHAVGAGSHHPRISVRAPAPVGGVNVLTTGSQRAGRQAAEEVRGAEMRVDDLWPDLGQMRADTAQRVQPRAADEFRLTGAMPAASAARRQDCRPIPRRQASDSVDRRRAGRPARSGSAWSRLPRGRNGRSGRARRPARAVNRARRGFPIVLDRGARAAGLSRCGRRSSQPSPPSSTRIPDRPAAARSPCRPGRCPPVCSRHDRADREPGSAGGGRCAAGGRRTRSGRRSAAIRSASLTSPTGAVSTIT